eukprot:3659670-Amphidinium_carterae.1
MITHHPPTRLVGTLQGTTLEHRLLPWFSIRRGVLCRYLRQPWPQDGPHLWPSSADLSTLVLVQ